MRIVSGEEIAVFRVKEDEKNLVKRAKEVMKSGCVGMAVGRNVWQDENPLKIARDIRKTVLG